MLDTDLQKAIVDETREAWEGHVTMEVFLGMFRGKERGHRIADYVEEQTVHCLEANFDVVHEMQKGKRRARGMGDAWVKGDDVYHPVNVKAGVHGIGGQPNVVSLAKLTSALLEHTIDSYYLLLVKFTDEESPKPDVQLVNVLHYLDFLHFDSGTGQLMLKADRFATHIAEGGGPDALGDVAVIERLVDMRRDGDKRLDATRAKKLRLLEVSVGAFDDTVALDQAELDFG